MPLRDKAASKPPAAPTRLLGRPAASASIDPEAVLAGCRATMQRMDDVVAAAGEAANEAAVCLALTMGADEQQVQRLRERQEEAKARKSAAADSATPAAVPPKAKKKKGWQPPQDALTRAKALGDGAPSPPAGLARCWNCFEDLPPAGPWDWLAKNSPGERDRPGQPLKRFLQPGPHRNFPTKSCSKVAAAGNSNPELSR